MSRLIAGATCKQTRSWPSGLGGAPEAHDEVAIWTSTRYQTNWSDPCQLAKVDERPHWNPVLFAAPKGRLHLFFKVGKTIPTWETWTTTSDDEGAIWNTPQPLVAGDQGGRGPVKNKPIVLADGTWLAGASLESKRGWDVFIDRSTDQGSTWEATEQVMLRRDEFFGAGVIQPALWESEPGQVHMLMRSTSGNICRSDSPDCGRTWSPIYRTELPNNNSGLDLARL